ncbi:hypothetical protein [Novipirellula maiorica]|uniref:hypothetical protein n=1 Tax=Novipirellula maiorica TaxID=1265734 RepID=UPI00034D9AED|nr:hypothetical protein [Rhodopirellula maiorica]
MCNGTQPQSSIANVFSAIHMIATGYTFAEIEPRLSIAHGDRTWHPACLGAITAMRMTDKSNVVAELENLANWIEEHNVG